jgi:hypothetical protein
MKLKYKDVKPLRETLLSQQQGICALCNEPIVDDAVLDHDHKTGLIRKVLHRGCNALLGKIENNMPRNRISLGRLKQIGLNLSSYIEQQHSQVRHPTHLSKEERDMKAYKKKKPGKR